MKCTPSKKSVILLEAVFCLICAASAISQSADEMPRVEGNSLARQHVVLPDAARGKVAVLDLGFSRASKVPTSDWGKKLLAAFGGQPDFALYQLPILEDVPRIIRGMVISGIRKGVPENLRDHFVPIVTGEAAIKKLVMYKEPDDAYLVVLNRAGKIVWQQHGSLNDPAYARLRAQIEPLLHDPD
jgi:hypothetical protein